MASIKSRSSRSLRYHRAVLEALEPRTLMSQTWTVGNTGVASTNGTNLNNILNGTATQGGLSLQLGDTIVLTAGATYQAPASGFILRNLTTGSGTITIETDHLANLPAGQRVGPSQLSYMATLTTPGSNACIIKTNPTAHDFTFLGLEMLPKNQTDSFTNPFLKFGDSGTNQNTTAEVPYNFVIDRCYIHGWDPVSTTSYANYKAGINLSCLNATVENSYISNIHNDGQDAQAIGGSNGLGNFTITNNFLEATGENVLFGGADSTLGVGVDPSNITITHNYFFKRLSWSPTDPSYYGIHWSVKNLLEFKHATHVFVDQNLFENCWVGADQVAPAIIIGPKNQSGGNTWTLIHDVTVTNNVIKNVGEGFQIFAAGVSDLGYTCLPEYNVTVTNNLVESIAAGPSNGVGIGFAISGGSAPGQNLTIDHNTVWSSQTVASIGGGIPYNTTWYNVSFTNNLLLYSQYGLFSTPGEGATGLNTFYSGITMSNVGTGYTAAPTVTFSGGGGTGATGVALINAGGVYNIKITNVGSGYTSAPTIIFGAVPGATGAAGTASITAGTVSGWTGAGNVMFGGNINSGLYPSSAFTFNSYTVNQDTVGFQDPAGELDGLLSTSGLHGIGTGGTDPGVNYSALAGITDYVPLDSTATGYWKFDENTGTSVSDSSGNGKTGTLSSSSLWTANGQSASGLALTGGTSGSVSVSSFSTTASYSFAAWVNPANFSATQYIASTANGAFSLSINTAGKLVATGKTGSVTASTAMTTGTWYLVGVTFNGSTLTVYQNGVAVGSVAATTATGSTTLYLGGNGGSVSSLNGTLDEARYYSSDMSATDLNGFTGMQRLYNNFSPLISIISPGGSTTLTTPTTTVSASAATHGDSYPGGHKSPTSLKFTWSVYSGPSATFDANNGTNAGQNCVVTWSATGTYMLKLTVTDADGGSTFTLHKLVVSLAIPNAPSSLVATAGTSSIALAWTDNATNETGFHVWRSTDNSVFTTIATPAANATAYTDTTASAGATYYYYVTAYNANGESAASNISSAMIQNIPNAPSTLAANPGTSSVALTWTDNSTNESGFHVYRSTDNATWGSPIATPAANATAYTDTTATAGTAYFYEVTAYNGSGDSSAAGITCAVATVTAYEGFNYTVGNGANLAGHNTGIGIGANWSVSNTNNVNITSGSLTYSSGTHALTTSANSVTFNPGASASTTLSSTLGTPGTTIWVGFELNAYRTTTSNSIQAEVDLNSTGLLNGLRLGSPFNGNLDARVTIGTSNWYLSTTSAITYNTTYFVAYKIDYLTTGDVITCYVNPVPGVTPTTASGTLTLPATAQLAANANMYIGSAATNTSVTFDEIRIGVSYAAVAPDPLVTPTYSPSLPTHSPFTIPNSPLNSHALFQSFLTAAPTPIAPLQLTTITNNSDYHLQGDTLSPDDPSDVLLNDLSEILA